MKQYFKKFKNNIIRKDETVNTAFVVNKPSSYNLKDRMDNLLEMSLTYESILLSITAITALALAIDRKSTRLNSSHPSRSRMPSSA